MHSKVELLRHLEKNKIRNINLLNFIKQYPINNVYLAGESILVKGRSDENWVYISSQSEDELKKLINYIDNSDECFAVIEDWMIPYLIKDKHIIWKLTCIKLFFPENVLLSSNNRYKIVELSVKEASYIYENYDYREYTSVEYISERILRGIALGIYEDNKLVAWIMTHDDGAIGFLTVLEGYRRKGYAYEITLAMINLLKDKGELPFVHIEEDNISSINLAQKIGFIKDRRIHWFKISLY